MGVTICLWWGLFIKVNFKSDIVLAKVRLLHWKALLKNQKMRHEGTLYTEIWMAFAIMTVRKLLKTWLFPQFLGLIDGWDSVWQVFVYILVFCDLLNCTVLTYFLKCKVLSHQWLGKQKNKQLFWMNEWMNVSRFQVTLGM